MIIILIQAGFNYGMHHVTQKKKKKKKKKNDTESCSHLTFSLVLQNSDDQ